MRAASLLVVALLLVAVEGAGRWAMARAADSADRRQAAAQFKRGSRLYEAGRYGDALDAFRAGYDAAPLPAFFVNIAQCQRKLGRLDDAAQSYQAFLDAHTGGESLRSEVEEALSEVRAAIAERRGSARTTDLAFIAPSPSAPPPPPSSPSLEPSGVVPAPETTDAPDAASRALRADVAPLKKARPATRNRKWVWALVGTLAAGAVVAGVTVAVVESQPSPRPGSLGLLDGRR